MLERAKSSILPKGNFREFFLWRRDFAFSKREFPGGPDYRRFLSLLKFSDMLLRLESSGHQRRLEAKFRTLFTPVKIRGGVGEMRE